jgi:predicted 3-demethylubiquinone-9 3-methyltransferase (glyoxalase superfamily)
MLRNTQASGIASSSIVGCTQYSQEVRTIRAWPFRSTIGVLNDQRTDASRSLKDKYGLSCQITLTVIRELLSGDDRARIDWVTQAFLKMKKFDVAEIKRAAAG